MTKKVEEDGVILAPDPFIPFTNAMAEGLEPRQSLYDREALTGQRLIDVETRPGVVGVFSMREDIPWGWEWAAERQELVRTVEEDEEEDEEEEEEEDEDAA